MLKVHEVEEALHLMLIHQTPYHYIFYIDIDEGL